MAFRALTLAASLAAAIALCTAAAANPPVDPCTQPDPGPHWKAVFGHVSSVSEAVTLKKKIAAKAFQNITFKKDYCDDIEVVVIGLDTPKQRWEFVLETGSAGLHQVSFEPPDTQKTSNPDLAKAVFGTRPTLARANELQQRIATSGYREGSDIEKLSPRRWRVVIYDIPKSATAGMQREARRAGFTVTFVPS